MTDDQALTTSEREWQTTRTYLNANRFALTRAASQLLAVHPQIGASALLAPSRWIPHQPIPLESIKLTWAARRPTVVNGREDATAGVRPVRSDGTRYSSYADAMAMLARPRVFEDRPAYRLSDVEWSGPTGEMVFTDGSYFDVTNVCEATAHEFARASLVGDQANLPLRQLIGDPCDPTRRPLMPAITTVTLRHDRRDSSASFVLHWRDPDKVASGGGLYQVAPVGMFQPAGKSTEDFDLWRNMAREFAEELLGLAELHDVDYASWDFYQELERLRVNGLCRPFCVGIGVDPLSLVVDILTVVVFEAESFDRLFARMVSDNEEGTLSTQRVPLTSGEITRFTDNEPMQPAGVAALDRVWHHREILLSV